MPPTYSETNQQATVRSSSNQWDLQKAPQDSLEKRTPEIMVLV